MIEKNINENLVKKDSSAKALLTYLYQIDEELQFENAAIYHNFPIYPNLDSDNTISANVIFVSKNYGLFIFQTIECSNQKLNSIESEENSLDDIDRLIFAKLLKESPILIEDRRRKTLKIDITSIIFLNNVLNKQHIESEFEVCTTFNDIRKLIVKSTGNNQLSKTEYKDLKATIEGSKGILKPKNLKDAN